MYYGDFLEAVGHTEEIQPAYVLVVYENEHFRLPWRYGDGFKKIRILDRSRSYVVLEAFGTPWEVLRAYARLSDIICYWRVTRSRDHREAFKWRKLDVSPLLSLLMWRSILLSWPYLEILEKQVQRITEVVRPAVRCSINLNSLTVGPLFEELAREGRIRLSLACSTAP